MRRVNLLILLTKKMSLRGYKKLLIYLAVFLTLLIAICLQSCTNRKSCEAEVSMLNRRVKILVSFCRRPSGS